MINPSIASIVSRNPFFTYEITNCILTISWDKKILRGMFIPFSLEGKSLGPGSLFIYSLTSI